MGKASILEIRIQYGGFIIEVFKAVIEQFKKLSERNKYC